MRSSAQCDSRGTPSFGVGHRLMLGREKPKPDSSRPTPGYQSPIGTTERTERATVQEIHCVVGIPLTSEEPHSGGCVEIAPLRREYCDTECYDTTTPMTLDRNELKPELSIPPRRSGTMPARAAPVVRPFSNLTFGLNANPRIAWAGRPGPPCGVRTILRGRSRIPLRVRP